MHEPSYFGFERMAHRHARHASDIGMEFSHCASVCRPRALHCAPCVAWRAEFQGLRARLWKSLWPAEIDVQAALDAVGRQKYAIRAVEEKRNSPDALAGISSSEKLDRCSAWSHPCQMTG